MRALCVVGTRPNFIKMAALYRGMCERPSMKPILVHTGQHYDPNMSDVFFAELDLPRPDIYLDVSGGSNTNQTARILERIEPVLLEAAPDLVVVVGDVNSTLAAGLAASQCGVPVAHVEAGLRSRDRTMPEEINRILVDRISDFLFVTERSGIENLKDEGIPDERVHFVGNVMIDTLMSHQDKAAGSDVLERLGLESRGYALVTLHRPANSDRQEALKDILLALREIGRELPVVLPIHPRTRNRIGEFGLLSLVEDEPGFRLVEPLGYIDFLAAMKEARVVLTDSGGIQEETTILGVPCLTMRNNTERPVTIECGTNTLVGTRGADIVRAFRALDFSENRAPQRPPLWDGQAAGRIIDILLGAFGEKIS
ncbi:UDP-N-acetylglucosamine 2-epimerase (non-hydrolyzing) [Candidatus Sumerlaeota bacterium]|nr:UDP-N-acetylglucosamine 2-epimerase (non-hydrolyzing) [Candidatus Sumerlaeota bacterium]